MINPERAAARTHRMAPRCRGGEQPVNQHQPHRNPWLVLGGFVGLVAIVALVSALAASSARTVYARLDLPSWAPAGWVFGPVWTVLYLTIALAGWLYWRTDGETRGFAAYGIALLFTMLWTPLFFAGGSARLALVDIVLLDIVVIVTIALFGKRSRPAGALLLPWLGWLWFSTALNAAVVTLN
jgi:tryptophan-rich sensory protein